MFFMTNEDTYDPWNEVKRRSQIRKEAYEKAQERERQEELTKQYFNAMSPEELAKDMLERCQLDDLSGIAELEDRLLEQAMLLNRSFVAGMHNAGLGRKTDLDCESYKLAMNAQKLCRQTFDSLGKQQILLKRHGVEANKRNEAKTGKGNEESQKYET